MNERDIRAVKIWQEPNTEGPVGCPYRVFVLLLALVSLSVLSGCHGAQYTEEEREELIPRD